MTEGLAKGFAKTIAHQTEPVGFHKTTEHVLFVFLRSDDIPRIGPIPGMKE